jgi:prepilin-type processing-associated H-X9-DG protein
MMNNRIKELAEQAGMVKFPPSIETEFQKNILFGDGHIEKFAELILQEVDKVVDNLYHVLPLEQAAVLLTFDEQLKDHFYGVDSED